MKIIFLITPVLFLFGCASTPTTQISAFGRSTSAITENVDAVMDEYNNAALERSFTDYAATYSGAGAPGLTSDELAKIAKPITPDQRKTFAISRANLALGAYATALGELASAASQTDIDLAAAKLYGSMVGLNEQYQALEQPDAELFKPEDFASFASVISAIGHAVVEKNRREALKKIITQSNPHIVAICDGIIAQLAAAGIEDSIAASRQYVLSEEIIDYNDRVKPSSTLKWKRDQIKRLYALQQSVSNSKLLVQQTQKAIQAVKQSHEVLAKEVAKNRFTSAEIASAIGRLKELESHYNDFESLLLSCDKIIVDDKGILSCE